MVKEEVLGVFKDFHASRKLTKEYQLHFYSYHPKKGAEDFKDFRLIILISSPYKLISKVLANRLQMVTGKLVNRPHNAFVKGRQILDASLIDISQ